MLVPCLAAAQGGASPDPGASARLDSIARLIAGLPPTHADHSELSGTRAWKEHSRAMQASWSRVRDGQQAALTAWRNSEIPRGCPAGRTLLYPFSGPDFLNAYWLFPDCASVVMFGLEQTGDVPDIEAMTTQEFARLLSSMRSFMINLFARNYFVTGTMHKDFRAEQRLRGVVPVLMVSMALSGIEVLRVVPLDPPVPSAKPGPAVDSRGERKRELKGVSIEFRSAGSAQVRRLNYFSLDATNAGLAGYPEFLDYLRSLAPTTTLIKSASYLLHGNGFSRMRDALLETSEFLVQDDTGLPYAMLLKRGWRLRVYGRYGVPIPPFEYAFQPALAAAYESAKPGPLPFRFGYQIDKGENRSNLMVGRFQSGQAGSGPGAR